MHLFEGFSERGFVSNDIEVAGGIGPLAFGAKVA